MKNEKDIKRLKDYINKNRYWGLIEAVEKETGISQPTITRQLQPQCESRTPNTALILNTAYRLIKEYKGEFQEVKK